jgi:hypothetical protein
MEGFFNPKSNELAAQEGVDEVLSPASIPPERSNAPIDYTVANNRFAQPGNEVPLNSPWSSQRRQKTGGREAGVPNQRARFDLTMSARVYGLRALATLVEVMENPREAALTRMTAANSILDRGFGKAVQCTQISSPDGGPVQHRMTIEFVGAPPINSNVANIRRKGAENPFQRLQNEPPPSYEQNPVDRVIDEIMPAITQNPFASK